MTGLVLLGAMIAGGREARAALTGITITGGTKPVSPDPVSEYIFNVYLSAGATIEDGDYFTVKSLTGVTTNSQATSPFELSSPSRFLTYSASWVAMAGYSISVEGDDLVPVAVAGNITWVYTGQNSIVNNTSSSMALNGPGSPYTGLFSVNTDPALDVTPTIGASIPYSFNIDGGAILSPDLQYPGTPAPTFQLADLVTPEPASSTIVLLTGGTGALAGLIVRGRRRRLARTA